MDEQAKQAAEAEQSLRDQLEDDADSILDDSSAQDATLEMDVANAALEAEDNIVVEAAIEAQENLEELLGQMQDVVTNFQKKVVSNYQSPPRRGVDSSGARAGVTAIDKADDTATIQEGSKDDAASGKPSGRGGVTKRPAAQASALVALETSIKFASIAANTAVMKVDPEWEMQSNSNYAALGLEATIGTATTITGGESEFGEAGTPPHSE